MEGEPKALSRPVSSWFKASVLYMWTVHSRTQSTMGGILRQSKRSARVAIAACDCLGWELGNCPRDHQAWGEPLTSALEYCVSTVVPKSKDRLTSSSVFCVPRLARPDGS